MLSITQSHGYFLALSAGGISCIAFMFVNVCFDVHPDHRIAFKSVRSRSTPPSWYVYLTSHASVLLWRSLTTVHYRIVDLLFDSSGRMRQGRDDRDIALSELSYTDE